MLEHELKSNICAVQESVQGHFSDDSSVCVHSQVEKDRSREHTDRSHNVVVFGVPESRDLLGTEELVSRAFESVVGRKVTIVDFKPDRNCTAIKLEVPEEIESHNFRCDNFRLFHSFCFSDKPQNYSEVGKA